MIITFLVLLLTEISSTQLQIQKYCSIQAITDHTKTKQVPSPSEFFIETYTKQTNVWTVYTANYLNGYNLDYYSENDGNLATTFTKSTGHFGLTCCIIVLQKLDNFNSTIMTIKNSIYQYSEHVVFINLIYSSFQFDTKEIEEPLLDFPLIFYFVEVDTMSIVCPLININSDLIYTSVQKLPYYKMHNLNSMCAHKNSVHIKAMWQQSQLVGGKIERIVSSPGCISSNRKIFHSELTNCFGGHIVVMLLSANRLNISFTTNWEENPTPLILIWLPVLRLEYPQVELRYKFKFRMVSTSKAMFMYCNLIDNLIIQNWNQTFSIFEGKIWALLLCVVLIYAFIYKNIFQAFDLLWNLVGKPFIYKHRPSIVGGFVIGVLMLSLMFSATFNTKFLNFSFPTTVAELAKIGYKLYFPNRNNLNRILLFMSPELQSKFAASFGLEKFSDLLSVEEGLANFKNFSQYISAVRSSKVLGIGTNVYSSSSGLTGIFSKTDKAVVEDKYICGYIKIPQQVYQGIRIGYFMWGNFPTQVDKSYSNLIAAGVDKQIQNMINFIAGQREKISWSPLAKSLHNIPVPLKISSSIGLIGGAHIISCLLILFCAILYTISCYICCSMYKIKMKLYSITKYAGMIKLWFNIIYFRCIVFESKNLRVGASRFISKLKFLTFNGFSKIKDVKTRLRRRLIPK